MEKLQPPLFSVVPNLGTVEIKTLSNEIELHRDKLFPRLALPIPFCPIMRLAKHLTVGNVRLAAFAPGCDVVGIHLG